MHAVGSSCYQGHQKLGLYTEGAQILGMPAKNMN